MRNIINCEIFTAVSGLVHSIQMGNETRFYEDNISIDYGKQVADLYMDDIVTLFASVDYYIIDDDRFWITVQERHARFAAECASALLTISSAHSCNPAIQQNNVAML